MFSRTSGWFGTGKKKPIRNSKKAAGKDRVGLERLEDRVAPANFTAGNIAVLDLAAASTNTTGSILELQPSGSAQTPVQTVPINGATGSSAMRFSNSGTSSYLSDSNDGSLLVFSGYNTTDTTDSDLSVVATNDPLSDRAVGTLNNSTNFTLQTTYTGVSGNQTRSATTTDDANFYITDKGGLYTNGATTASFAVNVGEAKSFGGTVYISSTRTAAQGNNFNSAIGIAATPTATSFTGLPGVAIDASIVDFYLIQSGSNGSTYDILYKSDGSTITKYSLVSSTWVSNGTYTVSGSASLSLIAENDGSGGAYLFYTTGASVVRITDTTGWVNSSTASTTNFTVTNANNQTLYTVSGGANDVFVKGIAFVPQAAAAVNTTTAAPSVSPAGTHPYGTNETFSAVVTASSGSAAPTAGSVTFMNGSTVLATATSVASSSGTAATFTVSSTTVPVGAYSNITAVYSPGTGFNGSTSSASSNTLTISGTGTTAAVPTFTPTTAFYGQSVAFTDVVTASSGSTAPTAGSVTFMSGSTVLATTTAAPTTSGLASTFTISTSAIPVAAYTNITAVYNPGTGFATSTSSASTVTLTINNNVTTTAVPTFTPTTVTVGQPVNFSAVVTDTSTSLTPTAGTVTFMSGSTVLATSSTETPSGNAATFTISSSIIPAGSYSNITAVYAPATASPQALRRPQVRPSR